MPSGGDRFWPAFFYCRGVPDSTEYSTAQTYHIILHFKSYLLLTFCDNIAIHGVMQGTNWSLGHRHNIFFIIMLSLQIVISPWIGRHCRLPTNAQIFISAFWNASTPRANGFTRGCHCGIFSEVVIPCESKPHFGQIHFTDISKLTFSIYWWFDMGSISPVIVDSTVLFLLVSLDLAPFYF